MRNNQIWRAFSLVSSLGLTLVSTLVVGFGVGYWCDQRLATFPWGTLLGIVLGIVAGFMGILRLILHQKNG